MRLLPMCLIATVSMAAACAPAEPPAAGDTPAPASAAAPAAPGTEATSLTGVPLRPPAIPDTARAAMETQLAEARAAFDKAPGDADALIWYGRRTAYLGRYQEAIAIFTDGIARHPGDARMYRHRGHRYLSTRQIDRAIADFERAAALIEGQPDQVEPDGQPNARNIPTSTLRSNTYYHLALGRYLKADFAGAADAWLRARDAVDNPDNLVAASHWLYLSLRRTGRPAAEAEAVLARIGPDLDVIENTSYYTLLRMYRGEVQPDAVLAGAAPGSSGSAAKYGVGAWYLVTGRAAEARQVFDQIVAGSDWPSFGYLAAEAEIARAR